MSLRDTLIIVEVGQFDLPGAPKSYQLYEQLTNGTWKCATNLPDGQDNEPVLYKDAKARMAQLNSVKAYGDSNEEEE